MKGDIEKHQLLVDEFEIALQGLKIGVPIFRYDEKIGVNSLAHMADPVAEEPCRNMFRSIQTEAVHLDLLGKPAAPIFELFIDGPIAKLDIRAHQIVEIAVLLVDFLVPLTVAILVDEPENAVFGRLFDVIDAAETFLVPDEFGMRAASAGKGETCVSECGKILVVDIRAIVGIDAANPYLFLLVGTHLVIENDVVNDTDAILFQRLARML